VKIGDTADAKPQDGRTAKGTFAPGNTFARGNPVARKMVAMRAALLRGVSDDDLMALGRKMYELALGGDMVAAKLLLAYSIGKPREVPDADRLDLDEFNLIAASPTFVEFMRTRFDSLDPALASLLLRQQLLGPEAMAEQFQRARDNGAGPVNEAIAAERKARIGRTVKGSS
jgi:hypothetical protein